MIYLFLIFFSALLCSLAGTPVVRRLGIFIGAMDNPNARKVHSLPVPRSGGIAIFLSFLFILILFKVLDIKIVGQFEWDRQIISLISGASLIFIVGLLDDIYRLKAWIKLLFQIISASIAFYGGLQITGIFFVSFAHQSTGLSCLSYCATVFWFVLLINAINLIDGLDGLAGGIVFLASVVLAFILCWENSYMHVAVIMFTVLAGVVLGFLRYNFNPASIYMGDSGSYFLGYMMAGLSIIGSSKAHAGAIILIPLLSLGVPVFDTILSPLRRFVEGKKLFQPDRSHIHHKLLDMGFTAKKAVFIIYGISLSLCLFTLLMINVYSIRSGLILTVIGLIAVISTRKLGYFDYIATDKILGWLRDISDVTGLRNDRRSFLSIEIDISRSRTLEEMWNNVCLALEMLKFDSARLYIDTQDAPLEGTGSSLCSDKENYHSTGGTGLFKTETAPAAGKNNTNENISGEPVFYWVREHHERNDDLCNDTLLRIELPLMNSRDSNVIKLFLVKDIMHEGINRFTMRRIEQLRSTMAKVLDWIEREKNHRVKLSG